MTALTAQPVLQFNGSGNETYRYLVGLGASGALAVMGEEAITTQGTAGTTTYALADNLGTVRDIVNTSSVVVDHIVYASSGTVAYESNTAVHHWDGFAGYHPDVFTGADDADNRWYDPAVIRWESEDPLGFGGGDTNVSRYVANGATNHVDPSGLTTYWYYLTHPYRMDQDLQFYNSLAYGMIGIGAGGVIGIGAAGMTAAGFTSMGATAGQTAMVGAYIGSSFGAYYGGAFGGSGGGPLGAAIGSVGGGMAGGIGGQAAAELAWTRAHMAGQANWPDPDLSEVINDEFWPPDEVGPPIPQPEPGGMPGVTPGSPSWGAGADVFDLQPTVEPPECGSQIPGTPVPGPAVPPVAPSALTPGASAATP